MNEDATTSFEVMEDALGFELSAGNAPLIEALKAEDMSRLARAVYEHTHSEYFRVPMFDHEIVGVAHVQSPVGKVLGGYNISGEHLIGRSIEELVGAVYLSLMTQDRLMLPDGLQYALDYYTHEEPAENIHERWGPEIVKVLTAYARLRPLFVARHLLIFPMDAWPRSDVEPARFELLRDALAASPFIARQASAHPLGPLESEKVRVKFRGADNTTAARLAHATAVLGAHGTRVHGLAKISAQYGLAPILDGPEMQNVFDALVRTSGTATEEPLVSAVESSMFLPHLGRLPVADFAVLKSAGDLRGVGKTLRDIDRAGSTMIDRPHELRQLVTEELRAAADEIGSIVQRSAVLKRSVTGVGGVCLGAIAVSGAAILAGYPADPMRTLVLSGATTAAGVSTTIACEAVKAARKRPIRRLYLKLAGEVGTDHANRHSL